jgi:hypothetical protein
MKAEIGKYGIWISQNEMSIIEKALEWMENSSYFFDKTSKIGVIKNLRKDIEKIRKNGVQIPKKVEIPNDAQPFIKMDIIKALNIVLKKRYRDWKNELPAFISLTEIADTIRTKSKRNYLNNEIGATSRAMGLKTTRHGTGTMLRIDLASKLNDLNERYLDEGEKIQLEEVEYIGHYNSPKK